MPSKRSDVNVLFSAPAGSGRQSLHSLNLEDGSKFVLYADGNGNYYAGRLTSEPKPDPADALLRAFECAADLP